MFRMNGTPRAQDAHDCRDAGGRAAQEQLPRSGASQFCTVFIESLIQHGSQGDVGNLEPWFQIDGTAYGLS